MDDTRVDLSQLEDPGTGRSVPTTPLQVSPQGRQAPPFSLDLETTSDADDSIQTALFVIGDLVANELASEVGQSSESDNIDASGSVAGPSSLPSMVVSMAEHHQVECEPPAAQDVLGKLVCNFFYKSTQSLLLNLYYCSV